MLYAKLKDGKLSEIQGTKGNESVVSKNNFESYYGHTTKKVFERLNEVSPSFCLAKWFNVSIHIPTGQTHSCYHPRSHHIPLEEVAIDVSALHNTKYKKQQRQLMLDGVRPSECEFCWSIEDSGEQLSDRAYRSNDVFEPGIIEEAKRLGSKGNARPRYVEVNFNQACNFKCSYCSPHLSTEWMKDIDKNGPYQLSQTKHNDMIWMENANMWPQNGPDNPYLLAFWEWFPAIYSTLKTFRMTGGEPLMDKSTFRIFDYVKKNPKKDLHLSITSNCCPPGNQWSKFMTSLKDMADNKAMEHFMLYCSLDSWGKQAEYIRNGMDFNVLYSNVIDYLENGSCHSLTFIITFNVLSYNGFYEYIENILRLRQTYNTDRNLIWFDMPQLEYPLWLNAKLNKDYIGELERTKKFMEANQRSPSNLFKGFYDYEISKVQRLIDWINGPIDFNLNTAMKDFYLFYYEYDCRNETSFVEVFPELSEFYQKCKDL
jgi:sulfatase maturation enzyme AslB (radical SAM superfamily)